MHIKHRTDPGLEEAIATALSELKGHEAHSDNYAAAVDQLTKLYEIKQKEMPDRLSKDQLLAVLGNVAGILLIISYEQKHVIVSKALGFIRPR